MVDAAPPTAPVLGAVEALAGPGIGEPVFGKAPAAAAGTIDGGAPPAFGTTAAGTPGATGAAGLLAGPVEDFGLPAGDAGPDGRGTAAAEGWLAPTAPDDFAGVAWRRRCPFPPLGIAGVLVVPDGRGWVGIVPDFGASAAAAGAAAAGLTGTLGVTPPVLGIAGGAVAGLRGAALESGVDETFGADALTAGETGEEAFAAGTCRRR